MRGSIVVITALMAVWFLRRKQYAHHWVSIMAIVAGVFIVGYVGSQGNSETSVLGIGLLLVSQCFQGGQLTIEEKLFDGYVIDPLYIIGFEGFWGCCVYAILLPIF